MMKTTRGCCEGWKKGDTFPSLGPLYALSPWLDWGWGGKGCLGEADFGLWGTRDALPNPPRTSLVCEDVLGQVEVQTLQQNFSGI